MSVLIFILVLSFLVVIHELGHYLVARFSGVKVEEFGIGYPPKAKTLFTDKRGTEYTFNWLPFGGFVRLFGEDGPDSVAKESDVAFFKKPVINRLAIVLAGAFINFVFGVIAFGIIYTVVGIPTQFGHVRIEEVTPGSPAAEAGLEPGAKVEAVILESEKVEVDTSAEFITLLKDHRGETVQLDLQEKEEHVPVYVRKQEEIPEGEGSLGVSVSDYELKRYPMWQMPFRGMVVGLDSALQFGWLLLQSLGQMVRDLVVAGEVPQELAGPVGIAYAAEKEDLLSTGWLAVLNFAAILSINLAIVNVLPLPALDGGRAAFLLWELLTGRRVKPEVERWVNTIGFFFLLGLIILISLRDIRMVFQDVSVQNFFRNFFSP